MRVTEQTLTVKSARPCNIVAGVCLALMVVGIILTTVIYNVIGTALSNGLAAQFVLDSPSAGDYGPWSSSDDPDAATIHTDFYVYNVSNADDVALRGAKPNLTEIGPISYYFRWRMLNVTWDPDSDGDKLSYYRYQYYEPVDDNARALEAISVTTLNVPLLGVVHSAPFNNPGLFPFMLPAVQSVDGTNPRSLFRTRTAAQLIWGWEDELLTALSAFGVPKQYPGLQENMTDPSSALAKHQATTMYTGKWTKNLAREYSQWDGQPTMQCCMFGPCGDTDSGGSPVAPWATDEAEDIRGAFGDQFHQNVQTDDDLYVSTHDFGIYRHWRMVNTQQYGVKGVNLLKYQWAPGTLGNASVAALEAQAYHVDGPSGLLNQSQCEWGAPIFVSQPRFFGGSASLAEGVDGLGVAVEADHDTWLGVEPYTGSTMDFHWRVGINAQLGPKNVSGTAFWPDVAPVFLPIAWADRYGSASDAQVSQFKSKVYVARNLMLAARWGGIALAAVALVAAVGFLVAGARRRRNAQHARELQNAAYFAEYYRPFLSPEHLGVSPISAALEQAVVNPAYGMGVAGGLNINTVPAGGNYRPFPAGLGAAPPQQQQQYGGGGGGVADFAGGGLFSPEYAGGMHGAAGGARGVAAGGGGGRPASAASAGGSDDSFVGSLGGGGGPGMPFPTVGHTGAGADVGVQLSPGAAATQVYRDNVAQAAAHQPQFRADDRRNGGNFSSTAGHA